MALGWKAPPLEGLWEDTGWLELPNAEVCDATDDD
jgi:hypothetical protein